ncbi:MAG: PIG-L family deacetylase [Acidimicrobiia bacterium]|nr:PIG-L family deacetylase [Acidimicrobiia bacterium]MBT8193092.1 PIG-L family deacetylase [Acidimicrobiia bacterium]MBT8246671.1 PIG-L family deacetylase [Acidimicrobiia bacterium]NNF89531.1 mycothiol conjugate amidase Mca [Acidimicrobiia bacterium]NNL14976.1 mycothiol conjugate amidase Mca [Acidimicrobiia bacterium]
MDHRLLAIHAHPDDESSKGAGTVIHYSDLGVRCTLMVATGGEEGDILNAAMDRPEVAANLPAIRDEELEAAAAILGFEHIYRLGYRDSGMPDSDANERLDAFTNADEEEALGAMVSTIRTERPQVVLGYDDHEYYPHPDHLRVHDLSLKAFWAAGDQERFPDAGAAWGPARLYAPVFSRLRLVKLHEAMVAAGLESPLGRWLERIPEGEDSHVDVRVPIASTLSRARNALRAHATQVDPDGFWFQIPEEIVVDVYPWEDFTLLASRDGGGEHPHDLFGGL